MNNVDKYNATKKILNNIDSSINREVEFALNAHGFFKNEFEFLGVFITEYGESLDELKKLEYLVDGLKEKIKTHKSFSEEMKLYEKTCINAIFELIQSVAVIKKFKYSNKINFDEGK